VFETRTWKALNVLIYGSNFLSQTQLNAYFCICLLALLREAPLDLYAGIKVRVSEMVEKKATSSISGVKIAANLAKINAFFPSRHQQTLVY
jgi:hypothetical protein